MSNEELVSLIQAGVNVSDNMSVLYEQNVNFIKSIVKKFAFVYAVKNFSEQVAIIEKDDLINEAYFGLCRAVYKFSPDQGVLFLTYASQWINQSIRRFLENCGNVKRIPVHTQEKVYKYNQVRSHYLHKFNREPSTKEYARDIGVSEKVVLRLENFMFQDRVKSLDEFIPGGESEDTIENTVASNEDVENDVIDRLAQEQLQDELWQLVEDTLKDKTMIAIIRMKFKECLTLKEIAEKLHLNPDITRYWELKAMRKLRNNARTRKYIDMVDVVI